MEKDEDGVRVMDRFSVAKTGHESKTLKSMPARSLKEATEETVKDTHKDSPKGTV